MRGEDERRLAVQAQAVEAFVRGLIVVDVPGAWRRVGVIGLEAVEVGELGGHAAEIVPHAAQDFLDLGGGFFRKGGGEIGAADAVLRQPRADAA